VEPFVRRRWPWILVTWTRVLAGEWRDPLVGRDVLVGCALGIAAVLCIQLAVLAPSWFGHPEESLRTPYLDATTVGLFLSRMLFDVAFAGLMSGLGALFVLFLLRVLLRRDWLAVLAVVLVFTAGQASTAEARWIVFPIYFLSFVLYFVVLIRVGLVSGALAITVINVLLDFPVTFQTSAWYSGAGYAAAAFIVGLALFGFRTSLGRNPALNLSRVED
jgi:hypothetical protein